VSWAGCGSQSHVRAEIRVATNGIFTMEGFMTRRLKALAFISAVVLVANLAYGRLNPVVASESGCGDWCENYTQCSTPCYICFPNPLEPPGACISW
jgi:hypothetical protein